MLTKNFKKKKIVELLECEKQNNENCSATNKMVERMQQELSTHMDV